MNGGGEGAVSHCQGRPSREKSRDKYIWFGTLVGELASCSSSSVG